MSINILFAILILAIIAVASLIGLMRKEDGIKAFLGAFIGTIIFFTVVISIGYLDFKQKSKDWNQGVCPECGEKWIFKSSDGGTEYWSCDNCQIVIRH